MRIEEAFSVIRNGASIKQFDGAGGIPITRIETIAERFVDREKMGYADIDSIGKYDSYVLQDGDILMSHINSVQHLGKTAIYHSLPNETIIHGMNLLGLRAIKNVMNPEYANYFFNSRAFLFQLPRITKKSVNQASFTVTELKKLSIPCPTLEMQQHVVGVLKKIDGIIDGRKKQMLKLDELVKSRFIEMFGELGTDTFGWGKTVLKQGCVINPLKRLDNRLRDDLIVSFVPMVAISEDGQIDANEVKPYKEVKSGFTYFANRDVLFAKITPCMENGKGAIARNLNNGIGFGSTEFHVLRPIEGKTNAEWLYMMTVMPKFRLDATNHMTGSAGQRRVPTKFLENYKISIPPIELQNEFADFVNSTDKSKTAIQKSLDDLETLKKSLMQHYFA